MDYQQRKDAHRMATKASPAYAHLAPQPDLNTAQGQGRRDAVVNLIMAYEAGDLTEDGVVALFQHLVDTGLAWRLQGSYGRMAVALIEAGHVNLNGPGPAPRLPRAGDAS